MKQILPGLGFLLLLLFSCGNPQPVRFAVIGHTYYVARDTSAFNQLMEEIHRREPDYLFVLGDMVWTNVDWEWKRAQQGFQKAGCPIYYSPGNHDLMYVNEVSAGVDSNLQKSWAAYGQRIGYYQTFFKDRAANYLLYNSNDSLSGIILHFQTSLAQSDTNLPLLVFTHHQPWMKGKKDYTRMPTMHLKGYDWEDLQPWFEQVDYVFDGDYGEGEFKGEKDGMITVRTGMGAQGSEVFFTWVEMQAGEVKIEKIEVGMPGRGKSNPTP
ncbi:MAG: metallophosphoesterase [Bacteroidia bacterium]|nr:metallophosphoesterase [Bacteroidia bacterium]